NASGWYLSPEQHAWDTFTFFVPALLLALLTGLCFRHPRDAGWLPCRKPVLASAPMQVVDRAIGLIAAGSYALLVTGKALTGRTVYLLAPCNLCSALLVYFALDATSPLAEAAFNYYLVTAWGVLVALATPDTRDQLLVPLYYLARRRYAVHTSLTSTLFYFACFILLHFGVYEVVSIASEQNLNYIMMPPRPLHKFGKSFRYIAVAAGAATTLLFRHIVVTGVLACIKALAPSPSPKAKTA
ncbi:tmem164, partial [Symbiodinium sp. KB8]